MFLKQLDTRLNSNIFLQFLHVIPCLLLVAQTFLYFFAELKGLNLSCKAVAKALGSMTFMLTLFWNEWSWDDCISTDFVLFPQVPSLGSSLSISGLKGLNIFHQAGGQAIAEVTTTRVGKAKYTKITLRLTRILLYDKFTLLCILF